MKLPKLFKRGKADDDVDEDDDVEEDFDDFDGDPDADASADDHVATDDLVVGGSADDLIDDDDDDEMTGGGAAETDGSTGLEGQVFDDLDDDEDDEEGGYAAAPDDEEHFVEDDDDIPDFDDEDEDEDDEGGSGDRKRTLLFAAIAGGVLLLGIAGGVGWWMLSGPSDAETATAAAGNEATKIPVPDSDTRVTMALPSRGGSLNALVDGGESPASTALTPPPVKDAEPAAPTPSPPPSSTAGTVAPGPLSAPDQASAPTQTQAPSLNAIIGTNQGPGQGIVIAASVPQSFSGLPTQTGEQLSTKPIGALLERKDGLSGPLPRAHKDGRRPMDAYAKPFDASDQKPRLALLITDLGLSRANTMAAIRKLPPEVSLMFNPYARDLEDWVLRARLAGHEVFIGLPMESENFPIEDGGPLALDSRVQLKENMVRLEQVLSKMTSYVGVVSMLGSKFKRAEGQLKPVLTAIRDRGLMFVDGAPGRSAVGRISAEISLPKAVVDVILDRDPSGSAVTQRLADLEAAIRTKGTAIAAGRAYPSSLRSIATWAENLKAKNLALVPVSAIADKQFVE